MLNNKKRIIVSITLLAILIISIIGVTYAYYSTNVKGNTSDTPSLNLRSGYLSITYTDGQEFIPSETDGTIIAGQPYTKTFTVTNEGVADSYYGVWFKDVSNPFTRTQDWTYELSIGTTIIKTGIVPNEDAPIITARPLAQGETETLTLKITYAETEEDQSVDMNKSLEFNISVTQSLDNLESAKNGTLLYAINRDNKISEPTIAFGEPTGEEAILAAAEDDYGTSYYFRGNVKNNFVTFSGMCWRIVRVQGDGTIKLVLADEDHVCSANVEANEDGTYSGYSTENEGSAFIGDASTQSFKYQTEYKFNEGTEVTNESDYIYETSDIPPVLNAWMYGGEYMYDLINEEGLTATFEQHISDNDLELLATTEWCNDMSYTVEMATNAEDGTQTLYAHNYGAQSRLIISDPAIPTLKCNMTGDNDSKALRYISNVGILTQDEIIFAGSGDDRDATFTHYLVTNATELGYFTMTPRRTNYIGSGYLYIGTVSYEGKLDGVNINLGSMYATIRPSIVLKRDVLATTNEDTIAYGEPGTQTNPYVIN